MIIIRDIKNQGVCIDGSVSKMYVRGLHKTKSLFCTFKNKKIFGSVQFQISGNSQNTMQHTLYMTDCEMNVFAVKSTLQLLSARIMLLDI